ncbi:YrbL family protein [Shimia ponticola]|uniref:YrbL family protein n=1 Tax=Shimia ponticola TaxID=2582893 RepID=UPI0011BDAA24|nr:YrbL family protein [Shimia ponticola]
MSDTAFQSTQHNAAREAMIQLRPEDVVAQGGERTVYVHPDRDDRLIKVIRLRHAHEFPGWSFGHITQRYFPSARYRPLIKQYSEYTRLHFAHIFDADFESPVSHLYGFTQTNLGLGCLTERVTDQDGQNAPTLARLVKRGQLTDDLLNSFNAFVRRLYDVSVCVGDANPNNFVYGQRHIGRHGKTSAPQWVLVDGFGDRFAIPLRTFSRRVRTLGLDDAFRRRNFPKGIRWNNDERRFDRE